MPADCLQVTKFGTGPGTTPCSPSSNKHQPTNNPFSLHLLPLFHRTPPLPEVARHETSRCSRSNSYIIKLISYIGIQRHTKYWDFQTMQPGTPNKTHFSSGTECPSSWRKSISSSSNRNYHINPKLRVVP